MADVTYFEALKTFQWSRPTAANPRLSTAITSTQTSLAWTNPPLDEDGKIVAGAFLMGIKNEDGYTETVYVPAAGVQGNGNVPDSTNLGLTATGVVRGINTAGLDVDTGTAALGAAAGNDAAVFCNVSAILFTEMEQALKGSIGSGGNAWGIGDETNVNSFVYAWNGDANKPYWGYNAAGDKWVFSNDGVSSTDFGTGAGVSGGDGIDVTAGVISADLAADPGLEFATALLRAKIKANGGVVRDSDGLSIDISESAVAGTDVLCPTGGIMLWGTGTAPTNWVLCDGTTYDSVADTTFADLFAVIGTTYGGTGAADFDVPDIRGSFPLGVSGSHALASSGGAETHTLTAAETPAHIHDVKYNAAANGAGGGGGPITINLNPAGTSTSTTSSVGSGTAHSILNPYLALNFIIKK